MLFVRNSWWICIFSIVMAILVAFTDKYPWAVIFFLGTAMISYFAMCCGVAIAKGYPGIAGFLLGLIMPPVGFMVVIFLPKKRGA
jgi:hypothetical protein